MNFLVGTTLFFLAVSLLFYVLFAGADFGAGILEFFLTKRRRADERRLIAHAMAPVWEANHVWLILAVVILFVGFPRVYTTLSIFLHIPMIALLVAIVARGCAFTFRHYDPPGSGYERIYSVIFAVSSVASAFILGAISGALMLGRINPDASHFAGLYVAPWLNGFSASLGIFTICLFAFLAAVFLVGETEDAELQRIFLRKAAGANLALLVAGVVVFVAAQRNGLPLARDFFGNRLSRTCFIVAGVAWIPFWFGLKKARPGRTFAVRGLASGVVALVMVGWYAVRFPTAVNLAHGVITFTEAAAPEVTLQSLMGALIFGCAVIFPALGYLFKVFKWETLGD